MTDSGGETSCRHVSRTRPRPFPRPFRPYWGLVKAISKGGLPETTLELVGLRVSQINGCAFCVDGHVRNARKAGESDERLFAVSAWHDAPYFTDAERAALALAVEYETIMTPPAALAA
ncbi:carboxymuconolactone decarboxylase family protein [Streptomyces sp. NPDC001455]|uniref:carboxymuconolactone decarboxylase family protein n=1 Tax=unclassified Streptomyces TaxID=2593676 RepID=UPI0033166F64